MEIYCPLYQKECITTNCIMWKEECLLLSFLIRSKEASNKKVPEEIINATADELAEELLQFTLKELEENPYLSIYDINELFWLNKNIEKYSLTTELKLKIKKVETVVQSKIKEIKNKHKNELNAPPLTQIEIEKKEPEEIINATVEELAEELFDFALNEMKEIPDMDIYDINELFWLNKNIEKYFLSGEIKAKIKKVEIIVKDKLEHYDRKEIEDLEDEISEEDDLEDSFQEVVTSLSDIVIKKKAPEILRNPSPEELATTIVAYTGEKFPHMEISLNLAIESYLESIGYKRYNLPMDIRVKIENAEKLIVEKLNEKKLISILPEILDDDPNKIANKIIEIIKDKYPDQYGVWRIDNSINDFLYDNNIHFSSLSIKNKALLDKAKNLAREIIKEEEIKIKEQENAALAPTIDLFYNWAIKHNLKKVTLADTDAFLSETGIILSYESRRNLYARTNIIFKSIV